MTRPRTISLLGACPVVAVGLAVALLAGCTDPEPPDETPAPTEQPTSGQENLDEMVAASLYVAWQELVAALPLSRPEDLDPEAVGVGIVVPDSPAAADTNNAIQSAIGVGLVDRGDIAAETLRLQPMGNHAAQAELCVSHDVQTTQLDTGEPVDATAPPRDQYLRVQVTYRLQGNSWLVEEAEGLDPQDCVPPSTEVAVRANWQAYVTAHADYLRAGRGADNIGELETLTTGALLERLRQSPGGTPIEYADTEYDLQLHHATRTQVVGDWCYDGNRNPEAGGIREDGTFVKHTHRQAETEATWELADGQWLLSSYVSLRADDPEAPEEPEEHRCF